MEKLSASLTKEVSVVKPKDVKLEPGDFGCVVELLVKDREGQLTERQEFASKSFVANFLRLLACWFCNVSTPAAASQALQGMPHHAQDTTGAWERIYAFATFWRVNAGVGVVTYGIICGTGVTAPTVDDYVMETPIAHGAGAGQLQYSAVTFGAPADDGTTSQFTVTRDFANASGGLVTVRELGIYVTAPNGYYLIIRDGVNIAVPNGQTLTVNYRLQGVV
jgi:hypothetical protein